MKKTNETIHCAPQRTLHPAFVGTVFALVLATLAGINAAVRAGHAVPHAAEQSEHASVP